MEVSQDALQRRLLGATGKEALTCQAKEAESEIKVGGVADSLKLLNFLSFWFSTQNLQQEQPLVGLLPVAAKLLQVLWPQGIWDPKGEYGSFYN